MGQPGRPQPPDVLTRGAPTAFAVAVLDLVERIPPGRVLTYGDVAELLGAGSPRSVGTVMARHGREVPWYRVVQASGRPAEPLLADALRRLRAEGCPTVGDRVDLAAARWRPRAVTRRAPAR